MTGLSGLGGMVRERTMRHPRGVLGRLGGLLMLLWNRDQEVRMVARAALLDGDRVLVVGSGPGLGVRLAADAVAPTGRVIAVDPSPAMRDMTARRCARAIAAGVVEVREGAAEHTGCPSGSVDVVIAVNNVAMWDQEAGFAELARVLRPGGRLLIDAHRHALDVSPAHLANAVGQLNATGVAAGFRNVAVTVHDHRFSDKSVELVAYR